MKQRSRKHRLATREPDEVARMHRAYEASSRRHDERDGGVWADHWSFEVDGVTHVGAYLSKQHRENAARR